MTTGLVINLINPPSSGSTWPDSSGSGNNATIVGTATYTSAKGGGYTTTSGGNYFSINYNITTPSFTISMACVLNPANYWGTLWGNESWSASQGYVSVLDSSTTFTSYYANGSTSYIVNVSGYNTVNIWDFVVNSGTMTVYKNGVAQSGTGTYGTPAGGYASNGLYFGARHTNAGTSYTDQLPGTYYSMRVYNIALTSNQILQNYNYLKGFYGLP